MTIDGAASSAPLPAGLPLFAGGLGVLGLFGWRKKRKKDGGNECKADIGARSFDY